MIVYLLRIILILLYLIIVSQGLFYLFALSKAFAEISIDAFAENRKAIDLVIGDRLRFTYIASLIVCISILIMNIKNPGSLLFITTLISFICLLSDLILIVKFNLPINQAFHTYASHNHSLDWNALRHEWLKVINYRGLIQIIGFISLLAGIVEKKY